ncbi:MAG: FtsW/RodA/SpoVE family cell cycle protein [Oscillospiraceae bacterium]|nr:FtsW/RodA/SpoVE family cell cycle protein [Oscillospiraceae bacterium]
MEWLRGLPEQLAYIDIMSYAMLVIRFFLPFLAIVIVARAVRSLLKEKSEAETWGYLSLPNGMRIDLNHWENVVGRAKTSDVYMEYPTLSRAHAAVIRDDKGDWRVYDISSKSGAMLNGDAVTGKDGLPIKTGDLLSLGGVELVFIAIDEHSEYEQAAARTRPGVQFKQRTTLAFLTQFQILLGIHLTVALGERASVAVPLSFLGLIALTWVCYIFTRALKRVAFEVETLAFFLSTLGLAVTASSAPADIVRQLMLLIAGVAAFFVVGWFLRDLNRAKKIRWPAAIAGILLLIANLAFSEVRFGARRWLEIGGFSFQPSEFVKIALVFAGAATLDRLFARRNLVSFIGFAGACVLALAMINDFGSALIFFVAYLVIAFMRSGDIATIFLSVGGAGFAGLLAIRFRSHIASRFATWGNAWEYANAGGYQQTRAMAAAASGGLFGVGAGNGWFQRVIAADTDLVFSMVTEELGLIIAVVTVMAILSFAVFSVYSAGESRSSFFVIGACAASSILAFQMLLNVLGSVDILPFTGVTFPFVSRGGTSLIACWGLLAFIKAADTRQNASFIVKTPKPPVGDLIPREIITSEIIVPEVEE